MSDSLATSTGIRPERHLTWRHGAGALVWVVAILVYALFANEFYAGMGATVGLMALLGLGMVLVTGYAGQFSLATGAFYGIGAYTSALLTMNFGWYGLLALLAGGVLAGVIGFALARPLFRLRGHFLAMATLALTEVFYLLVNNAGFTGGATGLGPIPVLNLFGLDIATSKGTMILNWIIVGIVLWGSIILRAGREGRALLAIRGHEAAAAAAGIDIASSKARVFMIAAVISSVAGSLYAHEVRYVNPPPFGFEGTIDVLMIAVLGGMRSPWGAIVGAIVLQILSRNIEAVLPSFVGIGGVGAGQQLILGLLLVIILLVRPDGLVGAIAQFATWARRRFERRSETTDELPAEADAPLAGQADMRAIREQQDAEGPPAIGDAVLEASGLVKRFGGVTAVDDVDLEIRSGEVLAIIGPNGAGKSTLVNMLSGNLVPTSGTVRIDGVDTTRLRAHQVARHGLARTFQTPALFEGMDVASTVKVGAHLRGRVGMLRGALPTLGALREERRLEETTDAMLARLGLDRFSRRDAKNLSLGQQKQVEIARALVSEPRILLLDEPCAGLNKAEKGTLVRLFRALGREGIAVLVIEHDMEFVMSVADRVQVINFGATLRTGTPAEVQADQAVIDAYLGVAHEEGAADRAAPAEEGAAPAEEGAAR